MELYFNRMAIRTILFLFGFVVFAVDTISPLMEDELDWEKAEVSNNYEAYHEPTCCSHRIRHYKGT